MNNPPKQFQKQSSEQGDRKWHQNEQEHGFEQRWDFFLEETKWMGAGISDVDPRGTHKPSRHALGACGPLVHLPEVCSVLKILKYYRKNHTKFSGHLENFLVIFLLHG